MRYDLVIRGGEIHDGGGGPPFVADIGVRDDVIASIGSLDDADAADVIDASGLAVAPGFINMLSHSYYTILHDPRSLGELTQGVTTQIFGEGWSMGPLTPEMRQVMVRSSGSLDFEVTWHRLSEYLATVEKRGTSQNVASFIGAATLRTYAVGHDDRPATPRELDLMEALVTEEMADGALGIGSALIYPPGCYASTEELIGLCIVAARHRGKYVSHLRSEGDGLLDGIGELLHICREAQLPGEVYHLKAAGRDNWPKMDRAVEMMEDARAAGEAITADVYPYTAGATGLASSIPPQFHEGGPPQLYERLNDPDIRSLIRAEIESEKGGWENLYRAAGGSDGIVILGVRSEELRHFQGRTLTDVADVMGTDPIDALIELVRRDRSRISTAYFIVSEDNLRTAIRLPWVSFGSDAGSMAPEGAFLRTSTHPRAYGTFARVLGRYVRDEGLLSLPGAVQRLAGLPAQTLQLDRRGRLEQGWFADVVVFDPQSVRDRATYAEPHVMSEGVRDVLVNGQVSLRDGVHTGRLAGRALFGPGRRR